MRLLKNKNFRRLTIGNAMSLFGSNIQQFALSLYVLAVTQSATAFASIVAIAIIPRLVLSPIAGVFGDWFDRKKAIVFFDFLNGAVIGLFAIWMYVYGTLPIAGIYILVIYLEITELFFGASMSAVIPSMVTQEDLYDANRIKSLVNTTSNVASPIVTSVIYGLFGLKLILLINAISFVISALMELTIQIPKTNQRPEKINFGSFKKDFISGIEVIKSNSMLKQIIFFGIILNFSMAAFFSVGFIYILLNVLKATPYQYGLIMTALSLSTIVGPLLLGGAAKKIHLGKQIILTFLVIGVLVAGIGLIILPSTLAAFTQPIIPILIVGILVFFMGFLSSVSNIAMSTYFVSVVPQTHLGRVGTFMNLTLTVSMPAGQMLFGIGLDVFSPALMSLASALIVILTALKFYKPFVNTEVRV